MFGPGYLPARLRTTGFPPGAPGQVGLVMEAIEARPPDIRRFVLDLDEAERVAAALLDAVARQRARPGCTTFAIDVQRDRCAFLRQARTADLLAEEVQTFHAGVAPEPTPEFQGMSNDTVYVVAPQGAGKTQHAAALAARFGCSTIVDDWDGASPVPAGALVLTSIPLAELAGHAEAAAA